MSESNIRVDYESPFVDTSIVVASFIEGQPRLYPSVAFTRKPMSPEGFEKNIVAGKDLEAEKFLVHCRKVVCEHVSQWASSDGVFSNMNESVVAKFKHPLLVAMYNIVCGYNATDPIPGGWTWPASVLVGEPEAIAGK